MQFSPFMLVIAAVMISAVAQISFKIGLTGAKPASPDMFTTAMTTLLAPGVLIGLGLYGLGTLLWLAALSRLELSQAYPFVGLGFVLTTLAGWWLFGDQLSLQRLGGIALVILGIILVARS